MRNMSFYRYGSEIGFYSDDFDNTSDWISHKKFSGEYNQNKWIEDWDSFDDCVSGDWTTEVYGLVG